MLIGQASIDENGTIRGTTSGDQTGREINIREFYSFPWNFVLRCKDEDIANKAATYMEEIARNSNFGYSQINRWAGYNSIKANGGKVSGAYGDFDCSSLVISCYVLAGTPNLKAGSGYTGNMKSLFMNTGIFEVYTDSQHLTNSAYMKRGDIYVNTTSHTVMGLETGNNGNTIQLATYKLVYKTKKANEYTQSDFIKDIQYLGGTNVDGIVGPLTLGVTKTISQYYNPRHTFVFPIQLRLMSMGYELPEYGMDGEYGPETEAAVKALQTTIYGAGSKDIDGEITARANTWKKLLGVIK